MLDLWMVQTFVRHYKHVKLRVSRNLSKDLKFYQLRLCQFFAASLDIKSFELHQKCFEIKPEFFHIVNVYFSEKAHDRAI